MKFDKRQMIIVGVILVALILVASVAVVMMSNNDGSNNSNNNGNGDGTNGNGDGSSGDGDGDGDNGDSNDVETGNWVDLSNVLPDANYSDVYVIGNEVWITSGSSTELYYNDAAGTTDFVTYSTPGRFLCVHMLNPNEGYAGTEDGEVYRTTDGGVNWSLVGLAGASVNSITFPPTADTGYCCGEVGNIYSVTSTGTTKMTSGIVSNMQSIAFPVSSSEGWVVGEDVIRHYTSASGQWNADQSYPGSISCRAVYFIDNNNGWIVGGTGSNGAIIHTTNGGTNWMHQTDPNPSKGILNAVFFLDDGLTGWAAGNFGRILSTTDGGNTWNIENTGASSLLRGIHFTSSTNGFIVGNGGNAYKFVGEE